MPYRPNGLITGTAGAGTVVISSSLGKLQMLRSRFSSLCSRFSSFFLPSNNLECRCSISFSVRTISIVVWRSPLLSFVASKGIEIAPTQGVTFIGTSSTF